MKKVEQARIILESLEDYLQIDWNFEEYYIKGIIKGLDQIEKESKIIENKWGLSTEHFQWFLTTHKAHMAAMGTENQKKYAAENLKDVRYDAEEDTVNVYYEDTWWHYDRRGTWY